MASKIMQCETCNTFCLNKDALEKHYSSNPQHQKNVSSKSIEDTCKQEKVFRLQDLRKKLNIPEPKNEQSDSSEWEVKDEVLEDDGADDLNTSENIGKSISPIIEKPDSKEALKKHYGSNPQHHKNVSSKSLEDTGKQEKVFRLQDLRKKLNIPEPKNEKSDSGEWEVKDEILEDDGADDLNSSENIGKSKSPITEKPDSKESLKKYYNPEPQHQKNEEHAGKQEKVFRLQDLRKKLNIPEPKNEKSDSGEWEVKDEVLEDDGADDLNSSENIVKSKSPIIEKPDSKEVVEKHYNSKPQHQKNEEHAGKQEKVFRLQDLRKKLNIPEPKKEKYNRDKITYSRNYSKLKINEMTDPKCSRAQDNKVCNKNSVMSQETGDVIINSGKLEAKKLNENIVKMEKMKNPIVFTTEKNLSTGKETFAKQNEESISDAQETNNEDISHNDSDVDGSELDEMIVIDDDSIELVSSENGLDYVSSGEDIGCVDDLELVSSGEEAYSFIGKSTLSNQKDKKRLNNKIAKTNTKEKQVSIITTDERKLEPSENMKKRKLNSESAKETEEEQAVEKVLMNMLDSGEWEVKDEILEDDGADDLNGSENVDNSQSPITEKPDSKEGSIIRKTNSFDAAAVQDSEELNDSIINDITEPLKEVVECLETDGLLSKDELVEEIEVSNIETEDVLPIIKEYDVNNSRKQKGLTSNSSSELKNKCSKKEPLIPVKRLDLNTIVAWTKNEHIIDEYKILLNTDSVNNNKSPQAVKSTADADHSVLCRESELTSPNELTNDCSQNSEEKLILDSAKDLNFDSKISVSSSTSETHAEEAPVRKKIRTSAIIKNKVKKIVQSKMAQKQKMRKKLTEKIDNKRKNSSASASATVLSNYRIPKLSKKDISENEKKTSIKKENIKKNENTMKGTIHTCSTEKPSGTKKPISKTVAGIQKKNVKSLGKLSVKRSAQVKKGLETKKKIKERNQKEERIGQSKHSDSDSHLKYKRIISYKEGRSRERNRSPRVHSHSRCSRLSYSRSRSPKRFRFSSRRDRELPERRRSSSRLSDHAHKHDKKSSRRSPSYLRYSCDSSSSYDNLFRETRLKSYESSEDSLLENPYFPEAKRYIRQLHERNITPDKFLSSHNNRDSIGENFQKHTRGTTRWDYNSEYQKEKNLAKKSLMKKLLKISPKVFSGIFEPEILRKREIAEKSDYMRKTSKSDRSCKNAKKSTTTCHQTFMSDNSVLQNSLSSGTVDCLKQQHTSNVTICSAENRKDFNNQEENSNQMKSDRHLDTSGTWVRSNTPFFSTSKVGVNTHSSHEGNVSESLNDELKSQIAEQLAAVLTVTGHAEVNEQLLNRLVQQAVISSTEKKSLKMNMNSTFNQNMGNPQQSNQRRDDSYLIKYSSSSEKIADSNDPRKLRFPHEEFNFSSSFTDFSDHIRPINDLKNKITSENCRESSFENAKESSSSCHQLFDNSALQYPLSGSLVYTKEKHTSIGTNHSAENSKTFDEEHYSNRMNSDIYKHASSRTSLVDNTSFYKEKPYFSTSKIDAYRDDGSSREGNNFGSFGNDELKSQIAEHLAAVLTVTGHAEANEQLLSRLVEQAINSSAEKTPEMNVDPEHTFNQNNDRRDEPYLVERSSSRADWRDLNSGCYIDSGIDKREFKQIERGYNSEEITKILQGKMEMESHGWFADGMVCKQNSRDFSKSEVNRPHDVDDRTEFVFKSDPHNEPEYSRSGISSPRRHLREGSNCRPIDDIENLETLKGATRNSNNLPSLIFSEDYRTNQRRTSRISNYSDESNLNEITSEWKKPTLNKENSFHRSNFDAKNSSVSFTRRSEDWQQPFYENTFTYEGQPSLQSIHTKHHDDYDNVGLFEDRNTRQFSSLSRELSRTAPPASNSLENWRNQQHDSNQASNSPMNRRSSGNWNG